MKLTTLKISGAFKDFQTLPFKSVTLTEKSMHLQQELNPQPLRSLNGYANKRWSSDIDQQE